MPFFDIFASPRWSPLRMRTKVVSFFIFFQELSNKKKIKALRPKMTKIASKFFCCSQSQLPCFCNEVHREHEASFNFGVRASLFCDGKLNLLYPSPSLSVSTVSSLSLLPLLSPPPPLSLSLSLFTLPSFFLILKIPSLFALFSCRRLSLLKRWSSPSLFTRIYSSS